MSARADERGSIVIALAVVLILSGLALAAAARTISAVDSARVAQDSAAATAAASSGLADAMFALDNGAVPDDATWPLTIGPASGPDYTWSATATDAGTVAITSTGTVNGRTHVLAATATRPLAYPWVLRTEGSLVLDGPATVGPAAAALASGGPLVLRNGAPGGAEQDLIGTGGSCAGCTHPATRTWTDASLEAPQAGLPCPGNGTITSLSAGTYVCDDDVTFSGTVTVAGPVTIYMHGGVLRFDGSTVNGGGDPTNLVVTMAGAGVVEPGDSGSAGAFTGVIVAPDASLASVACDFSLDGAMVLDSFACTSTGSGPTFVQDSRLGNLWSDAWSLSGTRDVGAA